MPSAAHVELTRLWMGEDDSEYRKAIVEVLDHPWLYTHVNYYQMLPSCFLRPV